MRSRWCFFSSNILLTHSCASVSWLLLNLKILPEIKSYTIRMIPHVRMNLKNLLTCNFSFNAVQISYIILYGRLKRFALSIHFIKIMQPEYWDKVFNTLVYAAGIPPETWYNVAVLPNIISAFPHGFDTHNIRV